MQEYLRHFYHRFMWRLNHEIKIFTINGINKKKSLVFKIPNHLIKVLNNIKRTWKTVNYSLSEITSNLKKYSCLDSYIGSRYMYCILYRNGFKAI